MICDNFFVALNETKNKTYEYLSEIFDELG